MTLARWTSISGPAIGRAERHLRRSGPVLRLVREHLSHLSDVAAARMLSGPTANAELDGT